MVNKLLGQGYEYILFLRGVVCFHGDQFILYLAIGQSVRKLIKDGLIIKKPQVIHSRSRVRRAMEAKRKGRHSGMWVWPERLWFISRACLEVEFSRVLKSHISGMVPNFLYRGNGMYLGGGETSPLQ